MQSGNKLKLAGVCLIGLLAGCEANMDSHMTRRDRPIENSGWYDGQDMNNERTLGTDSGMMSTDSRTRTDTIRRDDRGMRVETSTYRESSTTQPSIR